MEVSSHALALHRADGVRFAVAAFTNLTQDHLDFHGDMEEYFVAKRSLFAGGRADRAAINIDDPYGDKLAAEFEATTFSATGDERADLRAVDLRLDATGSRFRCIGPDGEVDVALPLPGRFNVENALCALAVAWRSASASRTPRRRSATPSGSPAASSPSTRASRSRSWSTTPTRRTRSRTSSSPPGRSPRRSAPDLRLRLRRRPRPRQAPAHGRDRGPARRPRRGHLRQPALRGPGGDHRRDPGWDHRGAAAPRSRSRPTAAPRSRSRSPRPRRATPS